jgi:hypothetical protein
LGVKRLGNKHSRYQRNDYDNILYGFHQCPPATLIMFPNP